MVTRTLKLAVFFAILSILSFWLGPSALNYTSSFLKSPHCQNYKTCKQISTYLQPYLPSAAKVKSPSSAADTTAAHEVLFTPEELKKYKGTNDGKLYLAILGKVFDVTRGSRFYGAGEGYHGFTGIDGSRAFVTGDFTEAGLVEDVSDMEKEDYLGLEHWVSFYEKEYSYVGKLVGRYYDQRGNPTEYWHKVQSWISNARAAEMDQETLKLKFPPCNVEYKPGEGSRVWCTTASGGVQRDWVGFPRALYTPDSSEVRCACVSEDDLDAPNLKEYPGCSTSSHSCKLVQ